MGNESISIFRPKETPFSQNSTEVYKSEDRVVKSIKKAKSSN